jgi:hypothetical protein
MVGWVVDFAAFFGLFVSTPGQVDEGEVADDVLASLESD